MVDLFKNLTSQTKQQLEMQIAASEFLKNTSLLQAYLEGEVNENLENQMLLWRAHIKWFDCALCILEGLGLENKYNITVQMQAKEIIREVVVQ